MVAPVGVTCSEDGPWEKVTIDDGAIRDKQDTHIEKAILVQVALYKIRTDSGRIYLQGVRASKVYANARMERPLLPEQRSAVKHGKSVEVVAQGLLA